MVVVGAGHPATHLAAGAVLGLAAAMKITAVVVLPLLGVLIYVLVRGDSMREREIARAQEQQSQMDAYVRQAAASSGGGVADELTKLTELKTSGVLSDEEFAAQKAKLLA